MLTCTPEGNKAVFRKEIVHVPTKMRIGRSPSGLDSIPNSKSARCFLQSFCLELFLNLDISYANFIEIYKGV